MQNSIIFWDWNGTLLDDVDICVESMNHMLDKRGMPTITKEYYRQVFGFPVIGYYEILGFDFKVDTFEDLSVEFISGYNSRVHKASLHPWVIETLNLFKEQQKKQVIVSAMEQVMLENLLHQHNIYDFFVDVKGLTNIYANGKTHLATSYITENNLNPKDIVFVGDTLHDAEVAKGIGSGLVLVSNGHHNFERLSANGDFVIQDLSELPAYLN